MSNATDDTHPQEPFHTGVNHEGQPHDALREQEALRKEEEQLLDTNLELGQRVANLKKINAEARDSRRAALNLMEDAIRARQEIETLNEGLRESEQQFRAVFNQTTGGIAQTDLTGRFTLVNDRYCDMAGRSREELLSLRMCDITHPDDVSANAEQFLSLVQGGLSFVAEERYLRPDGSMVWVHNDVAAVRDSLGRVLHVVAAVTDITDRKQMEERLKHFAVELEQRVTERTHELAQSEDRLRTLATELNLAEQRERKRLATELHDHLQQQLVLGKLTVGQGRRTAADVPTCEQVFKKVDDIFSDALTYTRTLVSDLSPTVLRDHGLAAALQWLGTYMQKHNQTVTVTVPDDEDLNLPEGQVILLFQSVRELLINSSKHAGTGEATVRMEQRDGLLRIDVRDEGAGFDLAAAAAAAAGTPSGGISSKFGLFSIRERMRALGGSFDIQSAPGKGTTATLVLSLTGAGEVEVKGKTGGPNRNLPSTLASTLRLPASRIRVLLVDDHPLMREGLRTIVTGYHHLEMVGEAGDGTEAVALAQRLDPDVVVMDINMPEMDGIEATRRIKAHRPSTIIIGLSVNQSSDTEGKMRAAGAAAYLTKESAADVLCQAIDAALLRKQETAAHSAP